MSAGQRAEGPALTRPLLRWLLLTLGVVAADQASKCVVVDRFLPGETLPVIPGVLHLTYVQNTGAAFGLFRGYLLLTAAFSLAVIGWLVWRALTRPLPGRRLTWAGALILAGALGNLIDRLRLGYVIDFIDLRVWPVFNLADSGITLGVGLVMLHAILERPAREIPRP